MYNREERHLTDPRTTTNPQIGPGTYDVFLGNQKKIKSDSYAPFNSLSGRNALKTAFEKSNIPGPAAYKLKEPFKSIKGCQTLANKVSRFQPTLGSAPGPTTYEITHFPKKSTLEMYQDKIEKNRLANRKLHLMIYRQTDPPSIPCPGKSYGYDEDKNGKLIKHSGPNYDTTMGPAYYNISEYDSRTTKMYKGNHFSNRTEKRNIFPGALKSLQNGLPGPADYDIFDVTKSKTKSQRLNIDFNDKTQTMGDIAHKNVDSLPRYGEMLIKKEIKNNHPGPGNYNIKREFSSNDPKKMQLYGENDRPPFGRQTKRFNNLINANPPPGTYNDTRTALESLRGITGMKRTPFQQSSTRFNENVYKNNTPGPGSYNYLGMSAANLKKVTLSSMTKGAFGSTEQRLKVRMEEIESMNQPAPNFYQNVYEDTKNKRYKINHQSSCFSSNTERMKQNIDANKILPGPGHYDTSLSYQQSQTHQSKAKPRNKHAEKRNNSFLSNEKRFSLIYDSKSNLTDVNLPAPNKYNIKNCDRSKNIISSRKKRFDINNNSNPPPNIYTFHPLHTNSVLKGTFNVTLNNPVIKELETIDESSEIEQNPMKQLLFGV